MRNVRCYTCFIINYYCHHDRFLLGVDEAGTAATDVAADGNHTNGFRLNIGQFGHTTCGQSIKPRY
jgi:hypothetical protein